MFRPTCRVIMGALSLTNEFEDHWRQINTGPTKNKGFLIRSYN